MEPTSGVQKRMYDISVNIAVIKKNEKIALLKKQNLPNIYIKRFAFLSII
jgi:hypothetical protein